MKISKVSNRDRKIIKRRKVRIDNKIKNRDNKKEDIRKSKRKSYNKDKEDYYV